MNELVLSLFPGIGLLDRAFELEGFCVARGPDLIWGGDVKKFHPPAGRFDGVIGGQPCQAFSTLSRIARARGHKVGENLIPEFERVVREALPAWFLMENVLAAPLPHAPGYVVESLCFDNRQAPMEEGSPFGAEQQRVRRFSFGSRDGRKLAPRIALFEHPRKAVAVRAHAAELASLEGGNGSPARTPNGRLIRKRRRCDGDVLAPIATVTANATSWDAEKQRPKSSRSRAYFLEAVRLQDLPDGFDLPGFTIEAKIEAVGNGVPITMGRAIARAVREAFQ